MRLTPLKIFALFAPLLLAAVPARAENVRWPTYYPSPYGNYQRLNTSERTSLGTGSSAVVTMATGGGRVGIGTAAPAVPFDVAGAAVFAGPDGLRGVAVTGASIQAVTMPGTPAPLILNRGGTHVGIGSNSGDATYALHVGGSGTIGLSIGGQSGEIKVAAGSDGNYYAVYAPG